MTPDANPLHQYFKTAVEEFHKTEAWKALLHVHMKVEVLDWGAEEAFQPKEDERGEFNYMKYVKQKLQIFRYYGDLLQTEQSKDPQTYAAPEGHVEAEIRPERLNGDKKDRPRINVYVPSLASKDVQDNYTKRNASDSETYFLCICLRAGQQLRELRDKLQPRPPPPQKGDDNEKPDPLFEPFEMEVEVPSIEGGVVRVRLSHPCRLSRQARKCIYCSRRREGLARCAGCKVVYYCSPEHQKLDWKAGHKQACPKHADASKTELTTWDATLPRLEETSLDLFAPESIDALEQFHASQEPVVPVTAMLRHVFEDNVGNESVQKLSALPKAGAPVDSWSTLFDACGLNAESDVEAGVLLSNVLSVYHAIMNMSPKLRETFEAKDEFVIHIPDACLEVFLLFPPPQNNKTNVFMIQLFSHFPKSFFFTSKTNFYFFWLHSNNLLISFSYSFFFAFVLHQPSITADLPGHLPSASGPTAWGLAQRRCCRGCKEASASGVHRSTHGECAAVPCGAVALGRGGK